ncbi:MAG: deoxyribose-phosphate aldolase [Bacillota bacterium]|nr:deoxyribose-phosphate aldolase [Bacillota bacterium]
MNTKITPEKMAKMIDQTLLKAYVSDEDFKAFCEESASYDFKMVAINSAPVKKCKEYLKGSQVHVGAAISFPLGQTTIETKVYETEKAIEEGADEIDYVVNIVELKNRNLEYIRTEMQRIVEICRNAGVTSKVIFENCYLTQEEKEILCKIALEVSPDYIKTSTGFGTHGATVEDVLLMKSIVGDNIKIKAAGGIRDLDTALAMIEAGAERIGTSAGVAIVEELKERMK